MESVMMNEMRKRENHRHKIRNIKKSTIQYGMPQGKRNKVQEYLFISLPQRMGEV